MFFTTTIEPRGVIPLTKKPVYITKRHGEFGTIAAVTFKPRENCFGFVRLSKIGERANKQKSGFRIGWML